MSDSHAAVVVSGAVPSGGSAAVVGDDIDASAHVVIAGRYGNGGARRAALGDKCAAVQTRVNALLSGAANAAGTSTGAAHVIAGTYKVMCDSLNMRSAPSLSGTIVT